MWKSSRYFASAVWVCNASLCSSLLHLLSRLFHIWKTSIKLHICIQYVLYRLQTRWFAVKPHAFQFNLRTFRTSPTANLPSCFHMVAALHLLCQHDMWESRKLNLPHPLQCRTVRVPTHPGKPGKWLTNFTVIENIWRIRKMVECRRNDSGGKLGDSLFFYSFFFFFFINLLKRLYRIIFTFAWIQWNQCSTYSRPGVAPQVY